jgi:glycosyltransferase 2 family protein
MIRERLPEGGRIASPAPPFCSNEPQESDGEPVSSPAVSTAEASTLFRNALPLQAGSAGRGLRMAERLLLACGITLFFVLLARLGLESVLANLRLVGWGIFLILAAEIVPILFNTLGWRAVFPSGQRMPLFRRLVSARIAGDAANALTPTATMGGEFVRVRMLQEELPAASLVASVIVAKITQTVGLVGFVAIGLLLVIDDTGLSAGARWGMFLGLCVFSILLAGLLLAQRRGLLTRGVAALSRWRPLGFLASLRPSIEQVDAEMARVHEESAGRIAASSVSFAFGYAAGILETYLILLFFRIPVTLELALAIEVLGVALNNLAFFVPFRAGTQEVGRALVFAMLGLSAAQGLAAGVIYRVRELTWALIGLALLAASRSSRRISPPRKPGQEQT